MVSTKIPLKVQKRSGFDKSHHNALTQHVGKIVPILCDEVIPNSKVYLRYAMAGSMAPLATDTYMKCYYDVRAFFVPLRLLWGGFESWFSNYPEPVVYFNNPQQVATAPSYAPYFSIDGANGDVSGVFGSGTLSDYLGYKVDYAALPNFDTNVVLSALPFFAYHRVVNDWFRQSNITREFYARPSDNTGSVSVLGSSPYAVAVAPFVSYFNYNDAAIPLVSDKDDSNLKFADGVSVFDLRSCNYDYDYFTNALPSAQLGGPMTVASVSSFTIPALRVANSLQQFAELNMLAGSKEVDVVRARYGAHLSSGVAQRCVYLGGSRLDISTKSVEVTATAPLSSRNPFYATVGSSAGKVYAQGSDIIIDGFTAQEPGYIMVVGMVIPKVTYGTGIRRYLTHYTTIGSLTDMANPLLQNVGNQPIYDYELTSSLGLSSDQFRVFGYTDRYSEFMTMEDEVHGLMALGNSLQSFVAQRGFSVGDQPVISSSFLEVKPTALDNISAIASNISNYGFWCQFAFDYKVSQPLAQYSLPSLQNPAYEHGNTIVVHRGGFRF